MSIAVLRIEVESHYIDETCNQTIDYEWTDLLEMVNSLDEAFLCLKAHMIIDLQKSRSFKDNYGFGLMEYYDLKWERERGNHFYIDGYNYQKKADNNRGFDLVDVTYYIDILHN